MVFSANFPMKVSIGTGFYNVLFLFKRSLIINEVHYSGWLSHNSMRPVTLQRATHQIKACDSSHYSVRLVTLLCVTRHITACDSSNYSMWLVTLQRATCHITACDLSRRKTFTSVSQWWSSLWQTSYQRQSAWRTRLGLIRISGLRLRIWRNGIRGSERF